MEIFFNNKSKNVDEGVTLADFISQEGISTATTAVAINMKVIKKTLWETTCLKAGDEIIVISATKGG